MANANKQKGDRCERAALEWLTANGFPGAQRTRAGYQRDSGDIHLDPSVGLAPGVIAQIKDWGNDAWPAWLKGTCEQRDEAQAKHAILVRKLRGKADPSEWLAVMRLEDMAVLLRDAGYGEPLEGAA